MKFTTCLAVLAAAAVEAHYTFPNVDSTRDWQVVRKTANFQSNGPVTDVTSPAVRCYQLQAGNEGATTYSVTAGGSLTWHSSPNVFHPGPMSGWLAKVPEGSTAATWDGSGAVWFKIYQEMPTVSGGGLQFASEGKSSFSFKIPSCIASGDYLFRVEHNALHNASQRNGAQLYISCAQINISGGSGSKTPTGLVAFPGAYSPTDPGILINIYNARSYTPAGPAVFTC